MKVELQEEELEGCITREEYAEIWDVARIRKSPDEILALLAFFEMLERSKDPVLSFSSAMLMWLDRAREVIRQTEEEDIPDGPDASRSVH